MKEDNTCRVSHQRKDEPDMSDVLLTSQLVSMGNQTRHTIHVEIVKLLTTE